MIHRFKGNRFGDSWCGGGNGRSWHRRTLAPQPSPADIALWWSSRTGNFL